MSDLCIITPVYKPIVGLNQTNSALKVWLTSPSWEIPGDSGTLPRERIKLD